MHLHSICGYFQMCMTSSIVMHESNNLKLPSRSRTLSVVYTSVWNGILIFINQSYTSPELWACECIDHIYPWLTFTCAPKVVQSSSGDHNQLSSGGVFGHCIDAEISTKASSEKAQMMVSEISSSRYSTFCTGPLLQWHSFCPDHKILS